MRARAPGTLDATLLEAPAPAPRAGTRSPVPEACGSSSGARGDPPRWPIGSESPARRAAAARPPRSLAARASRRARARRALGDAQRHAAARPRGTDRRRPHTGRGRAGGTAAGAEAGLLAGDRRPETPRVFPPPTSRRCARPDWTHRRGEWAERRSAGVLANAVAAFAGLGLRTRLLAILGLIAFYVPLAGGGPSVQRAGG